MKTIRTVINELTEMLSTFGDIPVVTTEENEPGKPLTPLDAIVALETGLSDENHEWIDDQYDTVCIISTSRPTDVLDRITKNL